jgi:hypothetical protein
METRGVINKIKHITQGTLIVVLSALFILLCAIALIDMYYHPMP